MPEESRKQESPIAASTTAKRTLRRISDALGIRQIDLLDKAVAALDDYYTRHGKRILDPLRFDETFVVYKIVLPASAPSSSQEPMILEEPPRAESKSGSSGVRGRTKTGSR